MVDQLVRLFRSALTVEDGDGRTVTGYAVPFGVEAVVDDGEGPYVERFERGAFRRVVKSPRHVELRYQHGRDLAGWVGKTVELVERDAGLWGRWRLDAFDENPDAKRVAYKVRDGQLPGLSVSYTPGPTATEARDGRIVHVRQRVLMLHHVALVPDPAYAPPEPLVVRSSSAGTLAESERSRRESWNEWRRGLTLRG